MNEQKDLLSLSTSIPDLQEKILAETDVDALKKEVDLFNLQIQKKNIIRNHKLNELQDMITNQMTERITKKSNEFSNQDLLTYFKTIQETISKTDATLNSVDMPAIKVTQNQVNILMNPEDSLSRESKAKVMSAVDAVINKLRLEKEIQLNDDIIDVEDVEIINDGDDEIG